MLKLVWLYRQDTPTQISVGSKICKETVQGFLSGLDNVSKERPVLEEQPSQSFY